MVLERFRSADGCIELLNKGFEIRDGFRARDHEYPVGPRVSDDLCLTAQ